MESTLLLIGKWAIIPITAIVSFVGFIVRGIYKKQVDTYTKEETEKLIDLKIKPVSTCIEHNSEVITELKNTNDKTNVTLSSLAEILQNLRVDQARVETKLDVKSDS